MLLKLERLMKLAIHHKIFEACDRDEVTKREVVKQFGAKKGLLIVN